MKKQILWTLQAAVSLLPGCVQSPEQLAKDLLQKDDSRKKIYNEIIEHDLYLDEFAAHLAGNGKARNICLYSAPVMNQVWGSAEADSVVNADPHTLDLIMNLVVKKMEKDTASCNLMCGKVLASERLKGYIMQHACAGEKPTPNK